MPTLKSLPIGLQTFELIIESQKLYVDKTSLIYQLIKTEPARYFLSRPRRFGKSVLLSTLECIFQGKKDLFKGLSIGTTDHDWTEYPVIRLDISLVGNDNETIVVEGLIKRLVSAAKPYGITLNTNQLPHEVFNDLITLIVEKTGKKLVVLIDEYDSVIVNQLHDHELVKKYFLIFRSFYQVTKSLDSKLQFVFVTGVSNFSKANMFSGLNHLHNISFNPFFATLCGYTQNELETYFKDRVKLLADQFNTTVPAILAEIKKWYDGYRFARQAEPVYNPFSTLQFFADQLFSNYWYQTGTPSFLLKAISNIAYLQPGQFENYQALQNEFDTLIIEKPEVLPMLFQTGYLTIKSFDETLKTYELGYPNLEVRESFLNNLLIHYSNNDLSGSYVLRLLKYIQKNEIDAFMETMKVFFANVPYDIHIPLEKYYQTIFYLILKLLGCYVEVEVRTNSGRIDAVLEIGSKIYIIEFKLNGTAEEALKQIEDSDYSERYKKQENELILIGVQFDIKKRNIGEWKVK